MKSIKIDLGTHFNHGYSQTDKTYLGMSPNKRCEAKQTDTMNIVNVFENKKNGLTEQ